MVGVLVLSPAGLNLAEKLALADDEFSVFVHESLEAPGRAAFSRVGEIAGRLFGRGDSVVFIMAVGIAVRTLAPYLKDKRTEPGAVVVDEAGDYAISLVGGHEGGANRLAFKVAAILGADPVVTTGSEVARELIVGVGCRRGTGTAAITEAVLSSLKLLGRKPAEVRALATIDIKRDETGLLAAAGELDLPIRFISKQAIIDRGRWTAPSAVARRSLGVEAVCEPAALLAGRRLELLLPKQTFDGVTIAIAGRRLDAERRPAGSKDGDEGWLAVVGTGSGGGHLTLRAVEVLERATDVVGYKTYLKNIGGLVEGKQLHSFTMGKEIERAQKAIELARAGRRVAIVSSGDAGVYGMAGPVLELLGDDDRLEVEIVPGLTSALAAAAAVGAPLMNDFSVISLSDLLTPWAQIERRLEAVAGADLVVALYNPKSRQRQKQFELARDILARHRPAHTPVAAVRNAGHDGQAVVLTDLAGMVDLAVDMRTILIVGNSKTVITGGRMVTERGYRR
jgi:cobalt-precorrin 5A hydrolase / precorrin-3B C17-methyltransferase